MDEQETNPIRPGTERYNHISISHKVTQPRILASSHCTETDPLNLQKKPSF